jgi:hypothetical protein
LGGSPQAAPVRRYRPCVATQTRGRCLDAALIDARLAHGAVLTVNDALEVTVALTDAACGHHTTAS